MKKRASSTLEICVRSQKNLSSVATAGVLADRGQLAHGAAAAAAVCGHEAEGGLALGQPPAVDPLAVLGPERHGALDGAAGTLVEDLQKKKCRRAILAGKNVQFTPGNPFRLALDKENWRGLLQYSILM